MQPDLQAMKGMTLWTSKFAKMMKEVSLHDQMQN